MKNQKGFSLIQVMVAVGIMGGLSLVMAQMMENGNKQINYIDFKLSNIDLKKELTYYMSFAENCAQTLNSQDITTKRLLGSEIPIDQIKNSDSRTLFKVGNTYHRDLILSGLTLKNYTPASEKITHQGVANLEYTIKAKKNVLGPSEIRRQLKLEMYFDRENNQVARCRVVTDGSTNTSNGFRSSCIQNGGIYSQGDRCKFIRPKLKGRAIFKSVLGNTVAYNDGSRQIVQAASKNAHAFCQFVFNPAAFALSFYENDGGINNNTYMGTVTEDLRLRELTARSSTDGIKLLDMIMCSQ